jgi:ATP-dependent helicase HrpB
VRLWNAAERLRPHREPELARVDLSGPVLEVLAWGGDPASFDWFEAPPAERVERALELLRRLGAVEGRRVSEVGERMRQLPLHPRLARVLLAAGGARLAARACALLSERLPALAGDLEADSDLFRLVDRPGSLPAPLREQARELESAAGRVLGRRADDDETALRRALFEGFPDRLARRREPGSSRFVLASGHGARLDEASAVRRAELVVALDLAAGPRGPGSEALIRAASAVDAAWVAPSRRDRECRLDPETSAVRAVERSWYDGLVLAERPVAAEPAEAASLLAAERRRRGLGTRSEAWLRRAALAGISLPLDALLEAAFTGRDRLAPVDLGDWLEPAQRAAIERQAPETLAVPSGRRLRLHYREDGEVELKVKLQELFGLGETPRVGGRAVLLSLLAPNGRPVQTTRDLRSFWERTYPEVRKELRGRYPKHPWPEDPWSARPTARAKRRPR